IGARIASPALAISLTLRQSRHRIQQRLRRIPAREENWEGCRRRRRCCCCGIVACRHRRGNILAPRLHCNPRQRSPNRLRWWWREQVTEQEGEEEKEEVSLKIFSRGGG